MQKEQLIQAVRSAIEASPKDGSKWNNLEHLFSSEGLRGNGALNNGAGADRKTRTKQLGTAKVHRGQSDSGVASHSVYVLGGETLTALEKDQEGYLGHIQDDLVQAHPSFESVLVLRAETGGGVTPVRLYLRSMDDPQPAYQTWWPDLQVEVCPASSQAISALPEEAAFEEGDLIRDAFIPAAELKAIVNLLRDRRNVILQGPPGVGKSFLAKRIAYAAMGVSVTSRVLKLQFHPGYSYEEFIEGYRPTERDAGTEFGLVPGSLKAFVTDVVKTYGDEPCVLILDEINRANLSTVLGETMSLIEADKRSQQHEVRTLYSREPFFLPDNLLVLGLMNTADRSIALVDYALRRRFAFVDLPPRFNPLFREHLQNRGIGGAIVDHLFQEIAKINATVRESAVSLGRGFEIGHSYFCNCPDLSALDESERTELGWKWLRSIVRHDIAPLLREYWFDDRDTRATLIESLFGAKLTPDQVRALVD